jgi:hypothetical protein
MSINQLHLLSITSDPSHTKMVDFLLSVPSSSPHLQCRRALPRQKSGYETLFCPTWLVLAFLDTAFSKVSQIPLSGTHTDPVSNITGNNKIPLVLSYHPFNMNVRTVIRRNFHILEKRPRNIFHFFQ